MGVKITDIVQEGLKNNYTSMLHKLKKVIVQEGLKTCILAQEGLFNSYIK